MSVQTSPRPILIIRYKRKKDGFSPYLIFSMLIHGGLALVVSATLLVNLQPPPEPYTPIRLVEEIPPPEPQVKKTPKARQKLEKKAELPQEVRPRSKPSRKGPVQTPVAPKVVSRQEPVPPAPKEVPKPPVPESAPAAPAQPKSLALAQPPSPSSSPSSSSMQKLLSPEAAPGSRSKSSSNLLAQLSERPLRGGEDLYRPAAPSGAESGPLPREIGGGASGGKSTGRGTGRGPASGIDRLAAGSGAGPVGQVANGGGGGEKGTGFRAPSRPISMVPSSKGGLGGRNDTVGGEKYLPFDSEDPDWGPYTAYLTDRILKFWNTPEGAETLKGEIRMVLTLERDGSLVRVRVATSSGYRILDQALLDAVNRAAPFRPFPEKAKGKTQSWDGTYRISEESGASKTK